MVKSAAKGVQQKSDLTYEKYKKVLYGDNETVEVKNRMIRNMPSGMSTIDIRKTGLNNIFTKSHLLDDRITVTPHKRHIFK